MGQVYAEIELISTDDLAFARKKIIGEEEIKRITITALVDTGAAMLCINENIQEYLQLPFAERRKVQLADGSVVVIDVVENVKIRFKNRSTICRAMVLPGDAEPLLGFIPLEDMDVLIDPLRQELIEHPDHPGSGMVRL